MDSLNLTYYPLHGKGILKIWICSCTTGHDQPDKTMTPLLIPQEPVATPQHCCHFHEYWVRRNHPLPYTQGQLIVITGVEDLLSAQVLLCHQPEVHQLGRAVCNYN